MIIFYLLKFFFTKNFFFFFKKMIRFSIFFTLLLLSIAIRKFNFIFNFGYFFFFYFIISLKFEFEDQNGALSNYVCDQYVGSIADYESCMKLLELDNLSKKSYSSLDSLKNSCMKKNSEEECDLLIAYIEEDLCSYQEICIRDVLRVMI